jgi:hypothetical protein
MKNKRQFVWSIAAFALLAGVVLAGCDNGTTDDRTKPSSQDDEISDFDLSEKIPMPQADAEPPASFSAAQYTGTLQWFSVPPEGAVIPVAGNFLAGRQYKVLATLTAVHGYALPETAAFTHNMADALLDYNSAQKTVDIVFVPVAYTAAGLYVNDNTTPEAAVPGLVGALTWIQTNAETDGRYAIVLDADETVATQTLDVSGVSIAITGLNVERTIQLNANGALFTLNTAIRLILGTNITLAGLITNTSSLVTVSDANAKVEMHTGSKITGNRNNFGVNDGGYGGGVYVGSGMFTMNGGEISGNSVNDNRGSYSGPDRATAAACM